MSDYRTVPEDDLLIIDPKTRTIHVPDHKGLIGVYNDKNAEDIWFKIPRYVGNGIDLMQTRIRINVENAMGDTDPTPAKHITAEGDDVYFCWTPSAKTAAKNGKIKFSVCIIKPTDSADGTVDQEWNTTPGIGRIGEGVEPDGVGPDYGLTDTIEYLVYTVGEQVNQRLEENIDIAESDIDELTTAHGKIYIEEKKRASAETARIEAEKNRQQKTDEMLKEAESAIDVVTKINEASCMEDKDEGKRYAYAIYAKDGIPHITLTEITK